MDKSRRRFIKIAGGTVLLAAGGKMAANAVAGEEEIQPNPFTPAPQGTEGDPISKDPIWGMVIDLKKVDPKSFKRIFQACHKEHNVPDYANYPDDRVSPEQLRERQIKWIWAEKYYHAFPDSHQANVPEFMGGGHGDHGGNAFQYQSMNLPVLCNHCYNPPCVRACPTKATFKRKDGTVLMDMHRCIGCRFCVSACPYGARSLNFFDPYPQDEYKRHAVVPNPKFPTRTKGVVEKCNFCAEKKLTQGEKPECVKACSNGEIVFGDLSHPESQVRKLLSHRFAIVRKPALGTQPKVFYVV